MANYKRETADEKSDKESATSFDPKIRQMMEMLLEWHGSRIEQLESVVNADDDTEIQVQDAGGDPITIKGDKLIGFKAGCSLAIELFGQFPVEMSTIHEDEEVSDIFFYGLETIRNERFDQVDKHGYSIEHDNEVNTPTDLETAAIFALTLDQDYYPPHWEGWAADKLRDKSFKERLAVAGAWCAAAISLEKYVRDNPASNN